VPCIVANMRLHITLPAGNVEGSVEFYVALGLTQIVASYPTYARLLAPTGDTTLSLHLRTKPYRPQTNGKVERLHQTMAREWAYGLTYRSHHHRNRALPHWLEHHNTRRATLRVRQPPTHQPRSQPQWAGHLASVQGRTFVDSVQVLTDLDPIY
jgi:integrase-like protein